MGSNVLVSATGSCDPGRVHLFEVSAAVDATTNSDGDYQFTGLSAEELEALSALLERARRTPEGVES